MSVLGTTKHSSCNQCIDTKVIFSIENGCCRGWRAGGRGTSGSVEGDEWECGGGRVAVWRGTSGSVEGCHWRELPQVSFLSRKTFCRNKQYFVQKYACRDKNMLAGNTRQKVLVTGTRLSTDGDATTPSMVGLLKSV